MHISFAYVNTQSQPNNSNSDTFQWGNVSNNPNDLPGVGEIQSQKDQILLKFKISTLSYTEKAFLIHSEFLQF